MFQVDVSILTPKMPALLQIPAEAFVCLVLLAWLTDNVPSNILVHPTKHI